MSWLFAILLVFAMAIVAIWPTYFWLRAVRVPAFIAGVFAPAMTIFLLVVLGSIYASLNIFWSGARVFPTLAVIGLLGFAAFRWSAKTAHDGPELRLFVRGTTSSWSAYFWLAVLVGWLIAVLPMMLSAPGNYPVQQWDPSFHMNGVWSINHEGNAEMGQALSANYMGESSELYPVGWHIFVALFSVPSTVVLTANASTLALTLLWVVGVGAYTRMLFPSKMASTLAPLVAGGLLSMPADALVAYSQWPNATALALMPGLAAFAIFIGRKFMSILGRGVAVSTYDMRPVVGPARPVWARIVVWVVFLLFGIAGGLIAHQSLAFNLLVLLLPAILGGMFLLWRQSIANRRIWGAALWPLTLMAGVYVLARIYQSPQVQSMGNYPRSGVSWQTALGNFLTPSPPYAVSASLVALISVVALLMLVGLVAVLSSRVRAIARFTDGFIYTYPTRLRIWPIVSFLLFAFLVLVAYGPDSDFRELILAPWYLDARRIMEPQNLAMVPIAALGLAALAQKLATSSLLQGRVKNPLVWAGFTAAALFLLASGVGGFQARWGAARGVYDPDQLGKPGMATSGEMDMLQSLDEVLPEDAVVLGDPKNGSVYVQMIGQRKVFFPQLSLRTNPSENQEIFLTSFNQIHTDPAVCQAIKEEGITHFYADSDGMYYSSLRSARAPGLYNVDTSEGFELVAQGDDARVYRITACD